MAQANSPDDGDALIQSEASYRSLVGQINDYAIFAMDPDGRALSWNKGVREVFGYARDEFLGAPLEIVFLPADIADGIPQRELEAARELGVANDDRWLKRKDGTPFFATGRTTRLTNAAGKIIGFSKVLRDDTQRALTEARLRESELRFRTLVENLHDHAIYMLDREGRITEWPAGARRVKGYAPQEVLGRYFSMFSTPEDIAAGEPDRELLQASREGRAEREGWRLRKGGERFWAHEIATAVYDSEGALVGFTKISQDLTERRRAEFDLKDSAERLREADRRKDEFLATLAHELRNPLAPLRNGLQIARLTSKADTPLRRTVEMMDRQLNHLINLVDDLLDIARISSGKIELRRRLVPLSEVLAHSVEASRATIDEYGHDFAVEIASDDLFVNGDFDRLAQVFSNLLSNAAKYTEPGGRLRVRLRSVEDEAVIEVIDNGIGIPAADLPRVFDLFSQVREHQPRAEGGLGIGLALVRSLVSLHGGNVTVDSGGAGRGSRFIVHLPLSALRPGDEPATDLHITSRGSTDGLRVLVADDNQDAAATLGTVLELDGHHVTVVHDGLEAVEAARLHLPDVVVLDLGMPRMDGITAARQLRSLPGGDGLLLIALTGWGQEKDRERTREAGFDEHLVKPVNGAVLTRLVTSHMQSDANRD